MTDTAELVTEPALVDFDTACRMLANMSSNFLRQEMHLGKINAQTLGRKIVFRPEELRRYAAERPSWEPRS